VAGPGHGSHDVRARRECRRQRLHRRETFEAGVSGQLKEFVQATATPAAVSVTVVGATSVPTIVAGTAYVAAAKRAIPADRRGNTRGL
jgi:hypothetical protein